MCGIIGYSGAFYGTLSADLTRLMDQASRRGVHAHGVAQVPAPGVLSTFRHRGAPGEVAVIKAPQIRFVGHCRYSTSDPLWDQPLADPQCALVMNGVISQAEPRRWPGAELWDYTTGNDVEVALQYAKEGIRGHMPGSFACLELCADGQMYAYRNPYRPLYWAYGPSGGLFFASTQDILRRGLGVEFPVLLEPGVLYTPTPDGHIDVVDSSLFPVAPEKQTMVYAPELLPYKCQLS